MFEELKSLTLSGEEYPIKCDLLVLEKAQEKYGSVDAFEKGLLTWENELDENGEKILEKDGKPKIKGKIPEAGVVLDALYWMANEGEAIMAEKEKRKQVKIERESLARKVDLMFTDLALELHEEFYRCFAVKNVKTTQNPKK